ncbi:MAG: class I SAM-dependent methyltransferase, partial [Candidatus Binatia bacterium]
LKHQKSEDAASPEFRYLLSYCVTEARRVFTTVELETWRPGAAEPRPADADYVLVLGPENVLFTVASLERMRQTIDQGAEVVVPSRLGALAPIDAAPIYTLRGYQLMEQKLLGEGRSSAERPASHLPVALFSGTAARRARGALPVSHLFRDSVLREATPALRVSSAGLFHEFIDYYAEERADLLPFLPPGAKDVLEIGCGRGVTGKLIQEQLGCRVTGIELHPEVAAEAAKSIARVIVGDVNDLAIDGRYDAIVASELFEHLADPEKFLRRMKALLRPGGRIVLSVPNVGHYAVVEDLMAGRWDYLPIGLLCYTHLRFFTRSTLEDWIARAGFSSHRIIPQTTELPERFSRLAASFACDLESLRTKGFYVILEAD